MSTSTLLPARSLVSAPRLPARPAIHTGDPFTTLGDIVVDCENCGYHAMGPRAQVKQAVKEHNRLFHSESIGVVLLNQPRQ